MQGFGVKTCAGCCCKKLLQGFGVKTYAGFLCSNQLVSPVSLCFSEYFNHEELAQLYPNGPPNAI